MVVLAGSLYLIATLAFGLAATVIGIRLILLSQRTGQRPERDLGLGLMLTAGIGYVPMVICLMTRQAIVAKGAEPPPALEMVVWAGWIVHNIGFTFMLLFIRGVFRPNAAWAKGLVVGATLVLWGGWLVHAHQGGIATGLPTPGYWVAFTMIGGYPIWGCAESIRYWRLMKRRAEIGLADPMVTNRFLLWFLASGCGMASIWIVNIPALTVTRYGVGSADGVTALSLLATAAFGIGTVAFYWLTFFPPRWYRRLIAGSETPA